MTDKIPTPITDKNGKQTTVHKNPVTIPVSGRIASVPPVTAPVATVNRAEEGGVIDGGDAIFRGEHVQVRLTYRGEGYSEEFDPSDPDDMPLARVDVLVQPGLTDSEDGGDDGWEVPTNTNSYCTSIAANEDMEVLEDWVSANGALFDAKIAEDLESDPDNIDRDISTFLNFGSYAIATSRIDSW